jgi:hypothetical protein
MKSKLLGGSGRSEPKKIDLNLKGSGSDDSGSSKAMVYVPEDIENATIINSRFRVPEGGIAIETHGINTIIAGNKIYND